MPPKVTVDQAEKLAQGTGEGHAESQGNCTDDRLRQSPRNGLSRLTNGPFARNNDYVRPGLSRRTDSSTSSRRTLGSNPFRCSCAAGGVVARISGEVRFDNASRAIYAADASNYRQVPIGVVIPKTEQDVIETIAICRQFPGASPFARAAARASPVSAATRRSIIDWSKYLNHIIELNVARTLCPRRAGNDLRRCRQGGQAAQSDLCARPGDARSLLLRRHAREQFLRRARADERSSREQRRVSRNFAL